MAPNQKRIAALFLTVAIAVAATLFFYGRAPSKSFTQTGFNPRDMVMPVSTRQVKKEQIIITKELPARVTAFEISEVRPEISGIIEKITFKEGSLVKAGTPLYQINASVQIADVEEAQANLKAAQAKVSRFKKLLDVEGISKQEYDDVLSEVALAKARLANAKDKLDKTKVLAPISGTIGKTNFTIGALATQNQQTPLTTITKLNPIYVDITQPTAEAIENKMNKNNRNLKVSLLVDGKKYNGNGKLQFTQSFADESTDSVTLRARFNNREEKLIPGMFVTAKIHLKEFKAIAVPQSAVQRDSSGNLNAFVVENGVANLRPIKADDIFNNKWIVTDGLQENEIIIDKGLFKIRPGMKVKISKVQ